ncbi:substrate-binding periplasmic protein [Pseudomonas sp. NPDC007930]|uniref:substrate-binding periplasmic protein n=1 Tax=Pseudomonas sp. NPDC007930 TaxID=3364417 RepID=UPI0036ECA13F
MFKPLWALLLGTLLAATTASAQAQQEVRIGAAHFPPYTIRPERGEDTGLLPELAEALNKVQSRYHFVLVPTSIPRRFQDLKQARTDMAIFENPDWGWKDVPHVNVDMGLEDAEVFVAHREPGRDQSYFANLAGKRLALFSGYHYAFANFNADPEVLASDWNATLTYSHDSNLQMVLRGRTDIALVTRSYLYDYLRRNPEVAGDYLVSDRVDQVYHHYALLRPDAPITAEQFAGYLKLLGENGELGRIFNPYRISVLKHP